jgi:hypothetical protein
VNLAPYVGWLVFLHVVGAFLFVLAHGVSAFVAFRVRRERDPARVAALLDLSGGAMNVAGLGLLILLVGGIVSGLVLNSFSKGWIWASIVVLVVVGGAMTPIGATYYTRLRAAVGQRTRGMKPEDPAPVAVGSAELAALLDSRRPEALAVVGGVGFLVILWLMMFRPF